MVSTRTFILWGSMAASASAAAFLFYSSYTTPRCRSSSLHNFKPQRNFKVVLADNSTRPFVHLRTPQNTEEMELHPFHDKISIFLENISIPRTPVCTEAGPPLMTEPFVWIDTKSQLVKLAEILSQEREFAVDTEQHSVRSFLGFTALIQVSTHEQDFLIDAIALHDEMGILGNVFQDANIRKVFHGADSDSLWLQRDFHIYIVNLFDTARACDILGKPQRSLAYLLQHYCGIVTNKVFQRADWRLRPLPEEMIEYARIDAHYLLYIADILQNELLQGDSKEHYAHNGNSSVPGSAFEECVRRSNLICLQLYEKDRNYSSPNMVGASLLSRYQSYRKAYQGNADTQSKEDERFQKILYALCKWRDAIARANDESPRFVLSDQAILSLAECAPLSTKLILKTVSMADKSVLASDVIPYMTPFPSPSSVLLQNIRALQDVLQEVHRKSKSYLQGCKEPHSDTSNNRKGLLRILEFCNLSRTVTPLRMIEKHEEVKASGRDIERRIPRGWKAGDFKASRERFVKKFSCKAPVYHNCRIYAGDGRLLCYCDRKKLDWYVQRGLAEFVDENPPAVKLLFEPKGRPEDENNEFYIQSKTNCCVGCGESSHYLRYRVIPSCYRQYFPEHLKSHRSHDIVLLCVDCHEIAHRAAEAHKKQVALDYGIPLFARRVMDSGTIGGNGNEAEVVDGAKRGASPLHLRTAAMALLRHGTSMPKERREHLEEVVRAYYGGRNITLEDIQAALLVGKGPRELRRLRKKKGLVVDNLSKAGEYVLLTERDDDNLVCENLGARNELSDSNVQESYYLASDANLTGEIFSAEFAGMSEDCVIESAELASVNQNITRSTRETVSAAAKEFDNESLVDEVPSAANVKVTHVNANDLSLEELEDANREITTTDNIPSQRHSRLLPSQRVSLLGHGPHGKKVVEMLLQNEGENGITQFCQRWRAVFVEAVKPTHLPARWDISHSGRREFGVYSVYNPSKIGAMQKE